jgi:hypothetical protein
MIKVNFQIIDPVSNQTIKTYSLDVKPSRVLIEINEARAVWDEYQVVASTQEQLGSWLARQRRTSKK